ncbi:MAG: sensor histidine kinase, partial [Herbiconiux sp.]|nr:sensor histidine kinase [Herbiconiux sp.]
MSQPSPAPRGSRSAATRAAEEWVRPRPDAAGYRNDAIVAAVLAVAAWLSSFLYSGATGQHTPAWAAAIWAVVIAGSLAFRRRFPELVALVVAGTFVVGQYSGVYEQLFANITLFLALYSVGAWGRNRMLATAVRILIATGRVLWLVAALTYQAMTPGALPEVSRDGP